MFNINTVKLLLTDQYFLQNHLEKFFHKKFKASCIIEDKPFFDKKLLNATPDLEKNYEDIKEETIQVLKRYDEITPFQMISPDQTHLSNDDRWKMFFLKAPNIKFEKNLNMMPKTKALLERNPEIISAYLSILGPENIYLHIVTLGRSASSASWFNHTRRRRLFYYCRR